MFFKKSTRREGNRTGGVFFYKMVDLVELKRRRSNMFIKIRFHLLEMKKKIMEHNTSDICDIILFLGLH